MIGDKKKFKQLMTDVYELKATGAMLITELGHGSDTKNMKTVATYDLASDSFIINTPDRDATKVWSGNLAQQATHGIVFAQLYVDGVCRGLNQFLVQLRSRADHKPLPGVVIGDMGPKAGLDGLDNGWCAFDKFKVPRTALLSRREKIDNEGRYVVDSSYAPSESSNGASTESSGKHLGALSVGRIGIIGHSMAHISAVVTIAIRFNSVRPVVEQLHADPNIQVYMDLPHVRAKLLPYLAATYVTRIFQRTLLDHFSGFMGTAFGVEYEDAGLLGAEIHVLSCVGKAVVSWTAAAAQREAIDTCGAWSVLNASRLTTLRDDFDPNVTYEGDNNVLLQQASNFLLKLLVEKITNNEVIKSPLNLTAFFNQYDEILTNDSTFKADVDEFDDLIRLYRFIACHLMFSSKFKFDEAMERTNCIFTAKSETQVYYMRTLAIVLFELQAICRFKDFLFEQVTDESVKPVLQQLGHLYALWSLEKHLSILNQANYTGFNEKFNIDRIQTKICSLCDGLAINAIALVDAIAPPDFILNSVLGHSDGRAFERLKDMMKPKEQSSSRIGEFTDLATAINANYQMSKL